MHVVVMCVSGMIAHANNYKCFNGINGYMNDLEEILVGVVYVEVSFIISS